MNMFAKVMAILNYQVSHLVPYYPYTVHGVKNPKFDKTSGLLLDLKNRNSPAVAYFATKLMGVAKQGHVVCVVPSHDPAQKNSGVRDVANLLINKGILIDGTLCLDRTKLIQKLSAGGNRGIQTHLDSIAVINPNIVNGKNVILLDDITTSGHSLQVCKHLLLEAGAASVDCLAFGETTH